MPIRDNTPMGNPNPNIIITGNFSVTPIAYFLPEIQSITDVTFSYQTIANPQAIQLLTENPELFYKSDSLALYLKLDEWVEGKKPKITTRIIKNTLSIIHEFNRDYPGNLMVFLCPPSHSTPEQLAIECGFSEALKKQSIISIHYNQLLTGYAYSNLVNPDKKSELPYTKAFYYYLTTQLSRTLCAIDNPHKVIVLDCDNTLWTGICGEDPLQRIKITRHQREFQKFLKQKKHEGFLLGLCSNNNETDVQKVFHQHPEMVLSMSDIAISKINWQPKSHKLSDIAKALNVGVDSLVFIDDSPVEIETVRMTLPELTAIQWHPHDSPAHLWALDKWIHTDDDRKRNTYYQEEIKRKKTLKTCTKKNVSPKKLLNLRVTIVPGIQLDRLSQLLLRVNQFRLNNLRFTPKQLTAYLKSNHAYLFSISASDKFGDYGIVGLLILSIEPHHIKLHEFCLSCRAIGRQIDLEALTFVQAFARKHHRKSIKFKLAITKSNEAAVEFIHLLKPITLSKKQTILSAVLAANESLSLKHHKIEKKQTYLTSSTLSRIKKPNYEKIKQRFSKPTPTTLPDRTDAVTTKGQLQLIWKTTLNRTYENNIDFITQASSLELTFFASQVYNALGISVPLTKFFELKNLSALSQWIRQPQKSLPKKINSNNLSYTPTLTQSLFYTSQQLHNYPLYFVSHTWRLEGIKQINVIEKKLWQLIHCLPALHSTLTEDGHILVTPIKKNEKEEKSNFITSVKTSPQKAIALYQEKELCLSNPHNLNARFYLFDHGNQSVTVVLVLNHLLFDYYSIDHFITKLLLAPNTETIKKFPSLADYTQFEKQRLKKESKKNHAYFLKHCANATPLTLPTRKTRQVLYSCGKLAQSLHELNLRELAHIKALTNTSLFELIFSVFTKILSFYHNSNDPFIIGTALSTRDLYPNNPEFLFGPLFSLTPICIKPNAKESFLDVVTANKIHLRKANQHKLIDLQTLIQQLQLARTSGQHPLFPVLFVWHESLEKPAENSKIKLNHYDFSTAQTEFDLIAHVAVTGSHLTIKFQYAKPLFDLNQIKGLLDCFSTAICYLTHSNLNSVIDPYEWIPPAYLTRIYSENSYSIQPTCIVKKIEEMARTYPDFIAIKMQNLYLTYSELMQKISNVTQFIHQSFAQEKILALNFTDRLNYLITLLATLKLEKTFIPISPEQYPFILSQDKRLGHSIPILTDTYRDHQTSLNLAILPEQFELKTKIPTPHLKNATSPVGYVYYTSGSTGTPKAVEINRLSLWNIIQDFQQRLNTNEQTRMLAHTPVAFDISLLELLLPLVSGGQCLLVEKETQKDLHALIEFIQHSDCNLIQSTPTFWHTLLLAGWKNETHARLMVGGEKLTVDLATQLFSLTPELWHVYGPTETTIWSLGHQVNAPTDITLGKPLSNTYCYVQNHAGFPALPGSYGELIIGGIGVAKRYTFSTDRKAFAQDPLNQARVYHTGDVVWVDPVNHSLHYMGRQDRQIKRYGRRIELGEIEHRLNALTAVDRAAVVASGDGTNTHIHAFIQITQTQFKTVQPAAQTLLPPYLLPDCFYWIEAMPTTANGKINYAQLKQWISSQKNKTKNKTDVSSVSSASSLSSTHLANPVYEWLAAWCTRELHQSSVLPHDNFFALGGNSLLAVKLAHDVLQYKTIPAKTTDIFNHPTLFSLATHWSQLIEKKLPPPLPFLSNVNNGIKAEKIKKIENESDKKLNGIGETEKIAIIGMAVKLPQINTLEDYWQLIKNNDSTIQRYPLSTLKDWGVSTALLESKHFKPVASYVEDLFAFDAAFFNFSPKEAEHTDPQHRILLELCWQALEDANIHLPHQTSVIGIVASCQNNQYLNTLLHALPDVLSRERLSLEIAADPAFLATKIAYKLGLSGPAINSNTTCSSGLTSVTEACQTLMAHNAEIMLAASASLMLPHQVGYLYEEGHIFSKTGHCKPFSSEADGTVPGSGAGVVVLKPLAQAQADGDFIYAVIEGIGINNDGNYKATYTAPSALAHTDCIQRALAKAKLKPHHIACIETHGTGTAIGDPIELEALKQGYKTAPPIHIGSVKAAVGHTNTAAGIVGLIKLTLARKHNLIPGNPYADNPLSELTQPDAFFKLGAAPMDWPIDRPYGAISSLGLGGTNVHLLLGPAPQPEKLIQQITTKTAIKRTVFNHAKQYFIKNTQQKPFHSLSKSPVPESFDRSTQLKTIFLDILGHSEIETHQDFFTLGGDSLSALDLIAHIENQLGMSVSLDEIQPYCSIDSLTNLLKEKSAHQTAAELIQLNHSSSEHVLVLIHPGNGNAYHYRPLAELLAPHCRVMAISNPIHQTSFASITEMAKHYLTLIEPQISSAKNYWLGGWSYGATVAQEMSYQAQNEKRTHRPDWLILLDGWAQYNKNLLKKELFFKAFFESPEEIVRSKSNDSVWLDFFWEKILDRMRLLVEHWPKATNQKTLLIKVSQYPHYYVDCDLKHNGWDSYLKSIHVQTIKGEHNLMMQPPILNKISHVLVHKLNESNVKRKIK